MHFLSRTLDKIPTTTWRELFSDPVYTKVRRTLVNGYIVETTWVGVVMAHEAEARVFLTAVYRERVMEEGKTDRGPELHDFERWATTEKAATTTHQAVCDEIRNG